MTDRVWPLALAIFALGAIAASGVQRWLARSRRRRRALRALRGEAQAERILALYGYRVVERQACGELRYAIDAGELVAEVRADLIVERRGRRFVAEVKTGEIAPRLRTPATRRQLLEYAHAFGVDAVLLVDAESERVHRVGVPRSPAPSALPWLVLGIGIGAAMAIAAMRWLP